MFPVGKIEIIDWSPEWPESFRRKASAIRRALGDRTLRIDHDCASGVWDINSIH